MRDQGLSGGTNVSTHGIGMATTIADLLARLLPHDELPILLESLVLVVVCGTTVLVLRCVNAGRKIDRYYEETSRGCYVALQLATVLLACCLVINARYLLSLPFRALQAGAPTPYSAS